MRSRTDPARLCPRCRLRRDACLCDRIPRLETRTRFLVLQHALEACKTTNTGHLATLALPNSQLGFHGGREGNLDLASVDLRDAALLFPGGSAEARPATVLVVDGTWTQARRMVQRIPELRALPRFSVVGPPGGDRLRAPHFEGGLATLEAMAEAVRVLEGDEPAEALHDLHRLFMARIRQTRGGFCPTFA